MEKLDVHQLHRQQPTSFLKMYVKSTLLSSMDLIFHYLEFATHFAWMAASCTNFAQS